MDIKYSKNKHLTKKELIEQLENLPDDTLITIKYDSLINAIESIEKEIVFDEYLQECKIVRLNLSDNDNISNCQDYFKKKLEQDIEKYKMLLQPYTIQELNYLIKLLCKKINEIKEELAILPKYKNDKIQKYKSDLKNELELLRNIYWNINSSYKEIKD